MTDQAPTRGETPHDKHLTEESLHAQTDDTHDLRATTEEDHVGEITPYPPSLGKDTKDTAHEHEAATDTQQSAGLTGTKNAKNNGCVEPGTSPLEDGGKIDMTLPQNKPSAGAADPAAAQEASPLVEHEDEADGKETEREVEKKEETQPEDEEEEEEEEEEEDDDNDDESEEEESEDEEEEEDEPQLKYARLTSNLGAVYRNGDATSAFLVAGDKMVWPRSVAHDGQTLSSC